MSVPNRLDQDHTLFSFADHPITLGSTIAIPAESTSIRGHKSHNCDRSLFPRKVTLDRVDDEEIRICPSSEITNVAF